MRGGDSLAAKTHVILNKAGMGVGFGGGTPPPIVGRGLNVFRTGNPTIENIEIYMN